MFFRDLLSGANGRLGYTWDDPQREDAAVNSKLTFAAKPKKNIDLTMERKAERKVTDGSSTTSEVVKTVSTLKQNHGKCTTKFTFANDKFAGEAKGNLVDDDGWKADITAAGEIKQAKGEYKFTGKLDAKTPDMGGAKAALNVDVEYNDKKEVTAKPAINLEISDEFNLGVWAKWNKSFSLIMPMIVYKPKDNKDSFYWLRSDYMGKQVRAGCDQQLKDGINHSFEAVYSWDGSAGIMGKPFQLLGGVEYELSDKTTLNVGGKWYGNYEIESGVEHKVDNNWTVSATQAFSSADKTDYHVGFTASYKL